MKFVPILLLILLPLLSHAQQSDSQLAYTYYQNQDYEKAAGLFLKLYERTRSSNFLDYHIICLINGKQYDQAENVLKKYLKQDDSNKDFLINLGYIYEQQGKTQKSQEYYKKAIQKLIPQAGDIHNLANKFRNIREYHWAIETYLQGRKILKQPDAFLTELGDNYMMERDYENMILLFFRSLELKPSEINSITSKLSFARSYDIINSVDGVIEKKLAETLKRPDYSPVFDEVTIWYALQKKDYDKALRHAILLNQKVENKLYLFVNIARNAMDAEAYETAIEAYRKIVDRGKENNSYYTAARKGILKCEYIKSEHRPTDRNHAIQLIQACEKYMQEFGYTYDNIDILTLLSDLYAYRVQQTDSADRVLERGISIRRMDNTTLNLLKSKRADLLTYMDNPWEATILYTQIEKSNPNNDIGYEAKLKKAWLAYYAGDLLWAKAQFDVLKGATSKLIANDAIKMAHFIHMNYEEEGDNKNLERLARAEYLVYKKQFDQAAAVFDSLIAGNNPGIADRASLLKAKILSGLFEYEKACQLLEQLIHTSGQTYIRAEAIFELARLKQQMQQTPRAQELYKLLVSEYPGSVYSVEAGMLYRELEKNKK